MRIGFTGTKQGMSEKQITTLTKIMRDFTLLPQSLTNVFRHGDCVGADAEAHSIVKTHTNFTTIAYPAIIKSELRAFCKADTIYPPAQPLERNKVIIANSNLLIATPKEFHEVIRSGTWFTLRQARKVKVPFVIIWPCGGIGYTFKYKDKLICPDNAARLAADAQNAIMGRLYLPNTHRL